MDKQKPILSHKDGQWERGSFCPEQAQMRFVEFKCEGHAYITHVKFIEYPGHTSIYLVLSNTSLFDTKNALIESRKDYVFKELQKYGIEERDIKDRIGSIQSNGCRATRKMAAYLREEMLLQDEKYKFVLDEFLEQETEQMKNEKSNKILLFHETGEWEYGCMNLNGDQLRYIKFECERHPCIRNLTFMEFQNGFKIAIEILCYADDLFNGELDSRYDYINKELVKYELNVGCSTNCVIYFIEEDEIKKIVKYLRDNTVCSHPKYPRILDEIDKYNKIQKKEEYRDRINSTLPYLVRDNVSEQVHERVSTNKVMKNLSYSNGHGYMVPMTVLKDPNPDTVNEIEKALSLLKMLKEMSEGGIYDEVD
jgi:hypothetical protein